MNKTNEIMILKVIITAESQDRTYIRSTSRHHIVKYTIPPASKHRQKNNNRKKKRKGETLLTQTNAILTILIPMNQSHRRDKMVSPPNQIINRRRSNDANIHCHAPVHRLDRNFRRQGKECKDINRTEECQRPKVHCHAKFPE